MKTVSATPKTPKKKSVNQEKHFFFPSNLSPNELNTVLTGIPGSSSILRGVMFLYDNILVDTYCVKPQKEEPEPEFLKGYSQVHSETLRSYFSNNYAKVIDLLIQKGYLEPLQYNERGEYFENGYYHFGCTSQGRCKSFRVPAHLFADGKKYQVIKQKLTQREIKKFETIQNRQIQYREEFRLTVIENMKNIELLRTPEALKTVDKLFALNKVRARAETFFDVFNLNAVPKTPVCNFGHRVHSQVVYSPKVLRPWMRFRDEPDAPLVEIDLINSQPAILANITPKLIRLFALECEAAIPFLEEALKEPDFQYYKAKCNEGVIYEFLRDEFNREYADTLWEPIIRDDAKETYYVAGFSNYQYYETTTVRKFERKLNKAVLKGNPDKIEKARKKLFKVRSYHLFKKLFPAAHRLFTQIKGLDWSGFNPGEHHSNNCLLAQRIESGIIFTRLVKALIDAGIPKEKIVTIHDSIMVREKDEEKARKVIRRELDKLHLNIQLKTKF
ncbi:hypothetical protein [Hymenobacter sp. BT730]|uniref:hypothetical protein n=1 Tax=Hymenobacter sp. BT730 TaxID=3063332 RepID=UPI0026E0A817|nr:hypothetical protein [Hymenobacter sp. BT730]